MLLLNYRDVRPIHEQIKDGIRRLLVSKAVETGERLPTVAELSSRLAVNPKSVKRAYTELEAEGYIYWSKENQPYAAQITDLRQKRKEELLLEFDEVVPELLYLSLTEEELEERIKRLKGADSE